jgi:long-chain acyl-CoA synthetase
MSTELYELFHRTARNQPDHPAILGPGADAAISYAQLDEAIIQTGQRLRRAGVEPGQCVGLHYPSGSDYVVLNYAAWYCGACVVPVATELSAAERLAVCSEISLSHLVSRAGDAAFVDTLRGGAEVALTRNATLLPIRSRRSHPPGYDHVDAAFIRFTSGTTGASKGVVLSHATVRDRIEAANEALRIGPGDRVLWLLSMAYHFTVSIVSYLSFGATIVLPANHFAAAVVETCRRHRTTLIYASPMHWALLADYPRAEPLETPRLAISTTSALDRQLARRFHQRYGVPLTQALGIIEVGLPCINVDFAAEKCESVGRVLPAFELRLEDTGLGPALQAVSFRGKGMLDAYYQPWRTRQQIMPDGWFRTGDVGELDPDGCLFLRGRSSDVISVMGMKFFPQEVENVLTAHPAVAQAGVFSQRDRRSGEVACARVVLRPGLHEDGVADDLRRWCAGRMASYKVPTRIEIVDSLQHTASGKLLHRQTHGINDDPTCAAGPR